MFNLLWTAVIGLVVGALAKLIMPGKDPGGILVTMILGIAGSFLGTFLGRLVGHYQDGQSAGFIMSLIGAIVLLAIYHFFKRRQVDLIRIWVRRPSIDQQIDCGSVLRCSEERRCRCTLCTEAVKSFADTGMPR